MNQTKIQVPAMAAAKAKNARPHSVEPGRNKSASRMPNCAEEMVAPVVGETNLFMQSCCMISPATLMPTPVHKMASRRGRREIRKMRMASPSPERSEARSMSITPTNREHTLSTASRLASKTLDRCFLIADASFLKIRLH